jgi:bilirubin oxidase
MFTKSKIIAVFITVLSVSLFGISGAFAQVPGGTLDLTTVNKFVSPLTIVPKMPTTSVTAERDYYEIAVRQFKQQILPPGMPQTTVWGYGSVNHSGSFSYPARTIEATVDKPVRVKWINGLVDGKNKYLPHLLPIDQTLHWANPPDGGDTMGMDPKAYTGPVPMVPHLHGAHVTQDSDGYPEAWFLPAAMNIPGNFAKWGSKYQQFKAEAEAAYGQTWEPGTSVFQYPNDQRAATLWFHDHSLGMTRANVYAGPAGFYILRGGDTDLASGLPAGAFEIPLVIQDKSFNADGSLFYPDNRAFFEGLSFPTHPEQFQGAGSLQIPFIPDETRDGMPSDISPIWNPEFFGNTMVVNGKTWPFLNVEQRRYRFRVLNASDSRFLILKLSNNDKFWQIGNEGGFLSAPAKLDTLLIAPAERADVIVDFTGVQVGTRIILQNIGPDEPFGGGSPCPPGQNPDDNPGCGDFAASDPGTTGQVLQFRVVKRVGKDQSLPPSALMLPEITPISGNPIERPLSLNELMSMTVCAEFDAAGNVVEAPCAPDMSNAFGPAKAQLGTVEEVNGVLQGVPHAWMEAITEKPKVGVTEDWVLYNFTADAHPIHLHQIQFQVIERIDQFGVVTGPEPWETGFKDTVIAYPGNEADKPGVTRVRVKFDIAGLFVWHCHILSHEDNEMMRPLQVLPAAP